MTEMLRVAGLLMLPAAALAAFLVLYFDWRGRLIRRARAEDETYEHFDNAA